MATERCISSRKILITLKVSTTLQYLVYLLLLPEKVNGEIDNEFAFVTWSASKKKNPYGLFLYKDHFHMEIALLYRCTLTVLVIVEVVVVNWLALITVKNCTLQYMYTV